MDRREIVEAFRQRLRGSKIKEKKSRFQSVKEWIGFTLSLAAFALSATAFYLSNVRRSDDFQLLLTGPIPTYRFDNNSFGITSLLSGTFINAGTRAIAVQDAFLLVSQKPQLKGDVVADCFDDAASYEFELEPFVVKPQEVAIKLLRKFKQNQIQPFNKAGSPLFTFAEPKAKIHPILVCLYVSFIVPDHATVTIPIQLFSEKWSSDEPSAPKNLSDYFHLLKPPIVLLKESGWSLFE